MSTCTGCKGSGTRQYYTLACGPQGSTFTQGQEPCRRCKGTGEITPARREQLEAGVALRNDRIARKITIREAAAEHGLDPVAYSALERGEA